jgi:hypothetical protein
MSETVSKRLAVTFNDGLPLGTHGSFTYKGERWIAVPLVKYNRILAATDRTLAALSKIRARVVKRVSTHPADAEWIVPALSETDINKLVTEKIEAQTS